MIYFLYELFMLFIVLNIYYVMCNMAGRTSELLPTDCGYHCHDRYSGSVLIGELLSELASIENKFT